MKKNILLIGFIISIIINIVLIVLLVSNLDNEKKLNGIYQATYYNTFNKQMLDTIKLENNNKCYYESVAYEYAGQNEKECTWTKEKNQIVISFENSDSIKIDILNNGDLLVDNTVFKKIN